MTDAITKVCSYCKVPKQLDEFHKDKYHAHGRAHKCKECVSDEVKRHKVYKEQKVKERLFVQQEGKCKICQEVKEIKDMHIDHDHVTDNVRGLLCFGCNNGLGKFKENPWIMFMAATYVLRKGDNGTQRYTANQTI